MSFPQAIEEEKFTYYQPLFRTHLRNPDDRPGVLDWYDYLTPDIQDDWTKLEKEFLEFYQVERM